MGLLAHHLRRAQPVAMEEGNCNNSYIEILERRSLYRDQLSQPLLLPGSCRTWRRHTASITHEAILGP